MRIYRGVFGLVSLRRQEGSDQGCFECRTKHLHAMGEQIKHSRLPKSLVFDRAHLEKQLGHLLIVIHAYTQTLYVPVQRHIKCYYCKEATKVSIFFFWKLNKNNYSEPHMTWLPATQRINLKTRHILIAMRLFKDTWHVTSRDTFKIPIETRKKNSQESLIIGNFCGK